jgi:hypothetical protein
MRIKCHIVIRAVISKLIYNNQLMRKFRILPRGVALSDFAAAKNATQIQTAQAVPTLQTVETPVVASQKSAPISTVQTNTGVDDISKSNKKTCAIIAEQQCDDALKPELNDRDHNKSPPNKKEIVNQQQNGISTEHLEEISVRFFNNLPACDLRSFYRIFTQLVRKMLSNFSKKCRHSGTRHVVL